MRRFHCEFEKRALPSATWHVRHVTSKSRAFAAGCSFARRRKAKLPNTAAPMWTAIIAVPISV